VKVQLEDANGDLLGRTVTNSSGDYSFDQLTGVGTTGDYTVSVVVPPGFSQDSPSSSEIEISRGGISVKRVDFVRSIFTKINPPVPIISTGPRAPAPGDHQHGA
jgi:hypothetical protein